MVSVIIPTYNREKTILKAVKSVLEQTYSDLEVIIIDDGSSDNTKDIIAGIQDKRVRYVYQDNKGACVARNKGIEFSEGKYIAFNDSDDVWHQDKLQKQIEVLEDSGADIVICQSEPMDSSDETCKTPILIDDGFLYPETMPFGIGTQTFFMRREVAENILFDPEMPRFQDLEWLIRAVQSYKLYGMKKVLVDYCISDDSITRSEGKMLRAAELILEKHPGVGKNMPLIGQFLSLVLKICGMHLLENNDPKFKTVLIKAYSCTHRKIDTFKVILLKCGLFPILYRVKNIVEKLFK